MSQPEHDHEDEYESVAIVGVSARFPGAPDAEQFWANLRDGVESIRRFTADELIAAGEDPARVHAPGYVPASPVLDDIELFDADFFAIPPREAELMDPQHRLFLEGAWQALEDAGCDAERYRGLIGVVGGVSPNRYLMSNLWNRRDLIAAQGAMSILIASDRDYMPTRVSYKLDLKGPSLNVQTACSTSLVA
ncbi:MAG TPA: polyketide synthase, partial [Polyangia bacterium]|nr:polyketide synthase [Polyangia bacterium]